MRRAKFKPSSTLIVQMMAHNEVECVITDDNKVFVELPTPDLGGVSVPKKSKDEDEDETPAPKKGKEEVSEKSTKSEKSEKIYTEKELMDMDIKEITKLCAKLDIDIPEDGKRNTNAKLRNLILDAQEDAPKGKKGKSDEEDAPKSSKGGGSALEKKVMSLLEDFDKGELSEKKLRVALADEGIDEELIDETIDEMNDDDKAPLGKFAAKLAGGEEAPAKKGKKSDEDDDDEKPAKGKKEKTVSIDELEEGDEIKAFWVEEDEWFKGTVTKIKGSKVYVDWEDGTNDFLDEEYQTKIVLL